MNPITVLLWVKDNWRLVLFAMLLVALGVQSYRLNTVTGERDVLAVEKTERIKRDALRELTNQRNKERTDEDYAAATARAAAARVQSQPPAGIRRAPPIVVAGGGDAASDGFDGRRLDEELTGFADRHAERLSRLLTDVSRRNAERLSAVAVAGEEVAAAYRACRSYSLNMVEGVLMDLRLANYPAVPEATPAAPSMAIQDNEDG